MFESQVCTFKVQLILQTVTQGCGTGAINLIPSAMDE